jgi:hypothetical protein
MQLITRNEFRLRRIAGQSTEGPASQIPPWRLTQQRLHQYHAAKRISTMLLEPRDLLELAERGGGGDFEKFARDLLRADARRLHLPSNAIDWDYRTNVPDGGCDIFVNTGHDQDVRLIPKKVSIWSLKSGKDGIKPTTFSEEVKAEGHSRLRQHLKSGEHYVWCALQPISPPIREQFLAVASSLAEELEVQKEQFMFVWIEALQDSLEDYPNLIAKHLPSVWARVSGITSARTWKPNGSDRVGHNVTWVDITGRGQLKEKIRQHLMGEGGNAVLHVAGLSGIGKTRTAIQACLDRVELADTLYAPRLADVDDLFLRHLEHSGRSARIVIDEVPLTDFQKLGPRFQSLGDRLRIVTLPAAVGPRLGKV